MSSPLTTHVLDMATGLPAPDLKLTLEHLHDGAYLRMADGVTDADGRCKTLLAAIPLAVGAWRLTFHVGDWAAERGTESFYPQVQIDFTISETDRHYHVPLLLSPYGYSTYRGS